MLNNTAIGGAKYLYLFIVLLTIFFFFKQPRDTQKTMIVYGIIALPIMYAVLKIAALFYFDPRPFVVGHFTPLIAHDPDNGFPSDHSVLTAAMATLVFPFNRRWGTILGLLAFCVAASRVYVGIHHPIDVITGLLIAMLVGWLVYTFILNKVMRLAQYKKLASRYFSKEL